MDAILDTIDVALRRKGLTDAAASKLAVGHPSLIKNLRMPREGEKRYNLPALIRLAEVLDLEFYFGPRRAEGAGQANAALKNLSPFDDAPSGFLTIPWAEAGLNKGSAPVAFSRAWLFEHGLTPDFLAVASPDPGVSDQQGYSDRLALIDTRSALRKGHAIWCYREGGRVLVSPITFRGNVTVVQSPVPGQEPKIIEGPSGGALSILGKVVWLGQSIPIKGRID